MKKSITLEITNYLTEIKKEIFDAINENKNILISSNPASGKTTLFAQLCINNVSSKSKNRIIFCAPYLIIQEQFKQRLSDSKVSIDFELNGDSDRKNINKDDKIITSTFKSFQRISESLLPEDIVIVDEAHSLLNIYSNKTINKHDHFGNFYKAIYTTKAKIVLMTGTPVDSFHYWFNDLIELKVINKSINAKVNIQYSNYNENDIVVQFAQESIKKHGKDSLNVIYVKSKNKCEKFLDIIHKLGYIGLVITSEYKTSDEYKKLANHSVVSKKFQFLITTNVISTGTNVLNDNMGRALMLDEHDPIEIKQFSKRFRKKLDIEIDVINKFQNKDDGFEDLRKQLIDKRTENRKYLGRTKLNLDFMNNMFQLDSIAFNQFGGEASQLNPTKVKEFYLRRNLLQEIYFHQEISKTYNNKLELVKALNQFDDILSIQFQEYKSSKIDYEFDEKAYQKDKKAYLSSVIDSFIENPEAYLYAFSKYINLNFKYSELKSISNILDRFKITENDIERANKVTIPNKLLKEIVTPLVNYYSLFFVDDSKRALARCLTFIKNVTPNKRSKYVVGLWFNEMFHDYFKVPDDYGSENNDLSKKKPFDNKNSNLIYFLLNQSFLFLMRHEEIYYQGFKDSILISSRNKGLIHDEHFPWHHQITLRDGKITEFDRNFGFGLLYSIFAIRPNHITKPHPKVKDRDRVNTILPSDLDSIKSLSFLNEKRTKEVIASLKPIKTIPPTYYYKSINLNASKRVIIDKNYLSLLASNTN